MSEKSLFMLGRQPAIGRAELESLFGPEACQPIGEQAILCDAPTDEVNFARLGGSTRLAKPLAEVDTNKWPSIKHAVAKTLPDHLDTMPSEGKIKLGLSVFGLQIGAKEIFAAGLESKKALKKAGRSVRLVPNAEPELSSAQVLHNQLTGDLGIELLIVKNGSKTLLAQTVAVQDIEAYARRDQGRPKRDARVGMLPPKLAQIIVNLSVDKLTADSRQLTVLDPFCGTGVVLQEALLMGYNAYGTDLEPRMIEYSKANLEWLAKTSNLEPATYNLTVGDATTHQWSNSFTTIASETYLGRPFSALPKPEVLDEVATDVNTILTKFLQNVARQTKPGFRLAVAVPAWRMGNSFRHLPLIDQLNDLGYNRVSFEHAKTQDLVYYRPDQIVARELLVITRK